MVDPGQGFFGHFALAIAADGEREPLGLLSVETIFRLEVRAHQRRRQCGWTITSGFTCASNCSAVTRPEARAASFNETFFS